jgi:hypothetical protein
MTSTAATRFANALRLAAEELAAYPDTAPAAEAALEAAASGDIDCMRRVLRNPLAARPRRAR